MAEEEDGVRYPGQHDFLLGRGGETNNHSGNILFRQLIKDYKEAYQNAPKTQKPLISQKLVAKWRSMDPPGRFLERSDPDKTWMDVGDAVACRKTSKALGERGKRTKTGNAPQDTHPDTGPAPASASGGGATRAGSKRKPETQHPSAPPASQLKRAPASVPAVINVTMPAPPQSNPAIAAAANASSAAAAANNTAANAHSATQDLSAVLQGLGVPNAAALAAQPNTCTGTATGTPSNAADALHALLKQQQQQNRTQQPIQVANIAALLGQSSNANAATLQNTAAAANVNAQSSDLNALLEQHKKNNDIALLLRNASNPPPATNTNPGIADVAALLQQQQEQRRIENISALLGQTTPAQAANSGTANLAALLGGQQQPQPQASLAALMEQQKQQQAQQTCGMAGIAALLQQQQPQSDVAALLQQQQQQQPQSNSIAAILQQQPQNNNIAAILQQQQQPQNDLSALLQQRRSNEQQQQSQNIVLSTLEQLQPHQRTPQVLALLLEQQQIQNSLSSILEQQAPPQQQSNLATLLGQRQQQQASQQNQDAVHSALVAALGLQQPQQQQQQPSDLAAMLAQRNPATAAIDVGSLLSAATGVATGTQQTATANPAPSERSAALAEVLSVLSRTDPENKTFGQASSTTAPLVNLDASQLQSLMARAQAPTGNAVAAASLQQGTMDPARLQSLLGGAQVSSQIASAAPAASLSDQGHLANMLAAAATATSNTSEGKRPSKNTRDSKPAANVLTVPNPPNSHQTTEPQANASNSNHHHPQQNFGAGNAALFGISGQGIQSSLALTQSSSSNPPGLTSAVGRLDAATILQFIQQNENEGGPGTGRP